jgi:hypothetical protein
MEKSQAREMIQWARGDFERHRNEKDIVCIIKLNYLQQLTVQIGKNQIIVIFRQASNAFIAKLSHFSPYSPTIKLNNL